MLTEYVCAILVGQAHNYADNSLIALNLILAICAVWTELARERERERESKKRFGMLKTL